MANISARALYAIPALEADCGALVSGPEETIQAPTAAGLVDPHPDAVAYAKSQKAELTKMTAAQATEMASLGEALVAQQAEGGEPAAAA